jgi:DNA-binding transcriptional MerR regulator
VTERSYLSIREVLDLLVVEFPDVTISKIRFLESRGLIHPERTPSGYRKFYDADVERLRWILRQQREHFLPLKVIKGRLEAANGERQQGPVEASLFDEDCADPPDESARLVRVGASSESETPVAMGLRLMGASPAVRPAVAPARASRDDEVAIRGERTASAIAGVTGTLRTDRPVGDSERTRKGSSPSLRHGSDSTDAGGAATAALAEPAVAAARATGGTPDSPARGTAGPVPGGPASISAPEVPGPDAAVVPAPAGAPQAGASPAGEDREGAPGRARSAQTGQRAAGAGRQRKAAAPANGPSDPPAGALASGMSLTADELAAAAGVERGVVAELEEYGLLAGRVIAGVRCYDEDALVVTRIAAGFRVYGIESRHLRTFKHAAEREAGLFSQVVLPLLRQRNPAARERAQASLSELASLGAAIQAALVRAELHDLTGG